MRPTPFDNYLIRPIQQNDAAAFFKMVEVNRPRLESGFAGTVSKTKN